MLLVVLQALVFVSASVAAVTQNDVDIIVDFFTAVSFAHSTNVDTTNVCTQWPIYVRCSNQMVEAINMSSMGLRGTLPASLGNLSLKYFLLSRNSINGTIPKELSRWGNSLLQFDVSQNSLSGTLPPEVGEWAAVDTFNVSYNLLTGTLPSNYSIFRLLHDFSVAGNRLTGTIPAEYSNWEIILAVQLRGNLFLGTLPQALSRCSTMTLLDFQNNSFSGTIPDAFASLTKLRYLDLSINSLTGTIPEGLSNLFRLDSFYCSSNSPTGTLPTSFSRLTRLVSFRVDSNQLQGTLPHDYASWGATLNTAFFQLNQFNGTLPPEYSNWTKITIFDVQQNQLTGSLPSSYSAWTLIDRFTASNNQFTGSLPFTYSSWTALTSFDVSTNALRGTLPPEYSAWSAVTIVTLPHNQLGGSIPVAWSTSLKRLTLLSASNNSLSGTIPLWAWDSTLAAISLSFNNISGTIPSGTLGQLIYPFAMTALDVQNNSFLLGTVPLFANLRFVTGCGTQLWGNLSENATLSCFPPGVLDLASAVADDDKGVAAINLSRTYSYSFPSTSAPTTTSAPQEVNNSTSNSSVPTAVARSTATTTVMAITAATSSFFALDAAEVQLLASILGSPCTCSATLADSDTSLLHLAVSPFSPLGLAWASIGNTLLSFAIAALHVLIVNVVSRHRRASQHIQREVRPSKFPVSSSLGRWLDGEPQRRQVASQYRFPNATVSLALLLLPGILRAVTGVGSQLVDGGDDEVALQGASMAIGITGIMLIVVCLDWFVHRHIDNEVNKSTFISFLTRTAEFSTSTSTSPHNKSTASPLRFNSYKNISKLFSPIPRRVAEVALPRGSWLPRAARKSYGGLVSGFMVRWRRAWCATLLLNMLVQVLSGIDVNCDVTQGIMMAVLFAASVSYALLRPHRTILVSFLTSLSMLLSTTTTLLALLCRLGSVTSDALNSFGVFVSVVIMCTKAYTIALPYVELRLLRKNGIQQGSMSLDIGEAGRQSSTRPSHRRTTERPSKLSRKNQLPLPQHHIELLPTSSTRGMTQQDALVMLLELISTSTRNELL